MYLCTHMMPLTGTVELVLPLARRSVFHLRNYTTDFDSVWFRGYGVEILGEFNICPHRSNQTLFETQIR
jgi:hypothetical protein